LYSALVYSNAAQILPVGARRYRVENSLSGQGLELTQAQLELLRAFTRPTTPQAALEGTALDRQEALSLLTELRELGILTPAGLHSRPPPSLTSRPAACLFRVPFHDPRQALAAADFCFYGVPYEGGRTGLPGAGDGPDALRSYTHSLPCTVALDSGHGAGWYDYDARRLLLRDAALVDAGNVLALPGEPPSEVFDRVTALVSDLVAARAVPVALGGDHSITLPILRGFGGRPLSIVHFDAHSDLEDVLPPEVLHHGNVLRQARRLPGVRRVLSLGLRGVGAEPQPEDLAGWDWLSASELRRGGVAAMLEALPRDGPVYVTLDLDVLDPCYAAAVGTPLPGGLTPWLLKELLWALGTTVDVVGFDLVELSPRDQDEASLATAAELLLTLAGAVYRRLCGQAGHGGAAGSSDRRCGP
jgi:agmatinase